MIFKKKIPAPPPAEVKENIDSVILTDEEVRMTISVLADFRDKAESLNTASGRYVRDTLSVICSKLNKIKYEVEKNAE